VIPHRWWLCALSLGVLATCAVVGWFFAAFAFFGVYVLFFAAYLRAGRLSDVGVNWDLSYGTYLYAWPVQLMLIMHLGGLLGPIALFALALPITLMLATLSWHFVEAPCMRQKARLERVAQERSLRLAGNVTLAASKLATAPMSRPTAA
jgi:peptidoglycan/LPS O-acetylase OafA/YrhL